MSFISSVIKGCHDLIVLEEYENAFAILDDIIGLEFTIEDHPDTDDTCEVQMMESLGYDIELTYVKREEH